MEKPKIETSSSVAEEAEQSRPIKSSIHTRIIDSFRHDPNQHMTKAGDIETSDQHRQNEDGIPESEGSSRSEGYDVESAIKNVAISPLAKKLKNRHLQMLAIGGSIGKYQSIPSLL